MLKVRTSKQFDRDYKKALKRGFDTRKFEKLVEILINEKKIPLKYRDHALVNSRDYKNMRECHIQPDWLLVYEVLEKELILYLVRTGTHSDLFNK